MVGEGGDLAETVLFVPVLIARQHTLGRLQFAELPSQLLPLRIDPRERLADPLLLLSNLI